MNKNDADRNKIRIITHKTTEKSQPNKKKGKKIILYKMYLCMGATNDGGILCWRCFFFLPLPGFLQSLFVSFG